MQLDERGVEYAVRIECERRSDRKGEQDICRLGAPQIAYICALSPDPLSLACLYYTGQRQDEPLVRTAKQSMIGTNVAAALKPIFVLLVAEGPVGI